MFIKTFALQTLELNYQEVGGNQSSSTTNGRQRVNQITKAKSRDSHFNHESIFRSNPIELFFSLALQLTNHSLIISLNGNLCSCTTFDGETIFSFLCKKIFFRHFGNFFSHDLGFGFSLFLRNPRGECDLLFTGRLSSTFSKLFQRFSST